MNDRAIHNLAYRVESGGYSTTDRVRNAVMTACCNHERRSLALPPLQIVTVDHYTAKWAVAAIEWLRRRRIADHILRRPKRIYIEVLEASLLPVGRYGFYNGVGGALADMIVHLLQPLRAIAGSATIKDLLDAMRVVEIRRAQYEDEGDLNDTDLHAAGADRLWPDTETFAAVHLEFTGPPWNGTPVFIRTGKGFLPESKKIAIEGFDDDHPVTLICDIAERHIRLETAAVDGSDGEGETNREQYSAGRRRVWLQTQQIPVPGPVSGRWLGTEADEYGVVFDALTRWETPDPRYFPDVEEAAAACDFFFGALARDRTAHPRLERYPTKDYTGEKVLSWMAKQAGWMEGLVEGDIP